MSDALQRLVLHESEHTLLPNGWHWQRLEDVATLLKPGKMYDESSVSEKGEVPVVNQSADRFHGFHNDDPGVMASLERPVFTFANHTCAMRLMKRPYSSIQNIFSRVGKPGVTDTVFLYYALLRRLTLSGYKGHHPIYRKQWIPIPPLSVQLIIASILSTYDNLIENNQRRIQLLEQSARLLYKEWFVHLRFPGHEHTTITDGVPEGWERKLISDVCETVGGSTPSSKVSEYWDGDITWVVPSDVTKNDCLVLLHSERKITESGLRKSSAKMVPANTILMTSRASVGFFALMDYKVCTNQGFISIIPHDDKMRMYLLFNLMSRVEEIRSNAKGTTYPEINKGRFRDMAIVVPPTSFTNEFDEFANRVIRQIRVLKKSTLQLTQARDLLLPHLMNGK